MTEHKFIQFLRKEKVLTKFKARIKKRFTLDELIADEIYESNSYFTGVFVWPDAEVELWSKIANKWKAQLEEETNG